MKNNQVTIQLEIRRDCVFCMKRIINVVSKLLLERRISMGLECNCTGFKTVGKIESKVKINE